MDKVRYYWLIEGKWAIAEQHLYSEDKTRQLCYSGVELFKAVPDKRKSGGYGFKFQVTARSIERLLDSVKDVSTYTPSLAEVVGPLQAFSFDGRGPIDSMPETLATDPAAEEAA